MLLRKKRMPKTPSFLLIHHFKLLPAIRTCNSTVFSFKKFHEIHI
nr:MAG TPA: hypothetical protein [Caudoviricetes sp.]